MNKISLIIFTYKRAILLDRVLESIFKNFTNLSPPIYIIYHFHPDHKKSYDILKKKWKNKKKIIFYERKKINFYNTFLYFIRNPLNILWVIKWLDIIKNWNSFKFLLEKILRNIKTEYVTMAPDDQYFYKKTAWDKFVVFTQKDKLIGIVFSPELLGTLIKSLTPSNPYAFHIYISGRIILVRMIALLGYLPNESPK